MSFLFLMILIFAIIFISMTFSQATKRMRKILSRIYLATISLGIIGFVVYELTCTCSPYACLCLSSATSVSVTAIIIILGMLMLVSVAPVLLIESVILMIWIEKSRKSKNRADDKVNKFKEEK